MRDENGNRMERQARMVTLPNGAEIEVEAWVSADEDRSSLSDEELAWAIDNSTPYPYEWPPEVYLYMAKQLKKMVKTERNEEQGKWEYYDNPEHDLDGSHVNPPLSGSPKDYE